MKSRNYVKVLIAMISIGLTSCELCCKKREITSRIYQPIILSLEKGEPVYTTEGVYIPSENEIWHSHARYTDLENKVLYNIK